ncbi:IclR family transcriptional regulator domain-containing protein [Streptomyces gobitricini]|uniref:IclR family transcriptional regulator domain-containing protein n=1 Tax=Streptomyces gobitricini TaxID=68211 RepID=UPI0031DB5F92
MSRDDAPRGERSEPPVPAGLTELLRELEGARDFWDRPYGTCGRAPHGEAEEERALANSFYRLGTKALRRGELAAAADWLGRAGEEGHPGALFRLAVVVHRRFGSEGREDAEFLVAEAARLGHGDARAMLGPPTAREAGAGTGTGTEAKAPAQDPEFAGEVRAALGRPLTASPAAVPPAGGTRPEAGAAGPGSGSRPVHGRAAAADASDPAAEGDRPGRPAVAPPPPGPAVAPPASGQAPAAPGMAPGTGAGPAARPVAPAPAPALRPAGGLWVPGGPDGRSRLWTPSPMRPPSLAGLAQQVPSAHESAQRWQQAMRVLDVLHTIGGADGPMSAVQIARGTGVETSALERLLAWLSEQRLVAVPEPGAYTAGPLLRVWAEHKGAERESALREILSELRDRVGAAVYVSRYTDGEVRISQYAAGPGAPAVREWVPFREAAHASAVGKSLLAQLDFEDRMDHLDRRRPVPLTPRTITDLRHLFHALDHHGPQAAQFDLLEYSNDEVCVAFPLTVAGRAGCVALSLPVTQQHRLLEAADALSNRSATLLATLLLAEDPPRCDPGTGQGLLAEDPPGHDPGTGRGDEGTEAFVRTGVPLPAE